MGGILYVYISIQLLYTYIYVSTQTPTTTTTPHMLVTGTRVKKDNTQPEQQALALRIYSMPELGFVPPSLGNLNILLTQNAKHFPKQLTYDTLRLCSELIIS